MTIRAFIILLFLLPAFSHGQTEIRITEEMQEFSIGKRNSLAVNVPFGRLQVVEKILQRELKDWGGKTESSRGEFKMIQGDARFLGGKPFDAFAKVVMERDSSLKIMMAVDLGGAFLSSKDHQVQYAALSDQLKKLALAASEASVQEDLDVQQEALSDMQKFLRKLERQKKSDEASIAKYEKKIAATKQRITDNQQNQETAKKDIDKQYQRVKDLEKRKKGLR